LAKQWGWQDQWKAQSGLCWICLQPIQRYAPQNHPKGPSEEHLVPVSRGGIGRWRNKLLAHRDCNSRRGAPFIWIKLSVFRRAAMNRIRAAVAGQKNGGPVPAAEEGVDLGLQSPAVFGSARTTKTTRRPTSVPSEMVGLRVSIQELTQR
jgi:hypothetical protein